MNKRLLILGANSQHVKHFAKINELSSTEYTIVLVPQHLKGYTGETDLIILVGWTTPRSFNECKMFEEEMHWFKQRNTIKRMHDEELLIDYKDEV